MFLTNSDLVKLIRFVLLILRLETELFREFMEFEFAVVGVSFSDLVSWLVGYLLVVSNRFVDLVSQ